MRKLGEVLHLLQVHRAKKQINRDENQILTPSPCPRLVTPGLCTVLTLPPSPHPLPGIALIHTGQGLGLSLLGGGSLWALPIRSRYVKSTLRPARRSRESGQSVREGREPPPSCPWTQARGWQGNPPWHTFRGCCWLRSSLGLLRDLCVGKHTRIHERPS